MKVFARIDESLALCGTDKSKILTATIYLNDVTQKREFNRALRGFDDYSGLLPAYRMKDLPNRGSTLRGQDVWLTVDADLQEETFKALKRAAGALNSRGGTARQPEQRRERVGSSIA